MRPMRLLILCAVVLLSTPWTHAATFSCLSGDTACLIAAIHTANANGEVNTITLAAGTYTLTAIDHGDATTGGANGLPSITSTLTLQGAGAETTVLARAASAPAFRLLHVGANGDVTLTGLTLTGGLLQGAGSGGGGLWNQGALRLTAAVLSENRADAGGGIANLGGTVTLQHSVLRGNSAGHPGGGLYTQGGSVTIEASTLAENRADGGAALSNNAGGEVTITHSSIVDNATLVTGSGGFTIGGAGGILHLIHTTVARNRVFNGLGSVSGALSIYEGLAHLSHCTVVDNAAPQGGTGGVVALAGGTLILDHTILARNTGLYGQDCSGVVTSQGHNLIGDPTGCTITLQPTDKTGDPGLDAFTDDGTPGHGHYPLLASSQAIDAGDPQACPATDQLGQPRAGICDIGAVEFQPEPVDVVALRQAVYLNALQRLWVVATSSEPAAAHLSLTVPGCLQDAPLVLVGTRYVFLDPVPACGGLDGQAVVVRSSLGGVVSGVIR